MTINPLEAKTRVATTLRQDYVVKSLIGHYGGFSTSQGLFSVIGQDILVIAPKVLHESIILQRPDVVVVTPQSCIKRPPTQKTVLWMYAISNSFGTVSAVLSRKKSIEEERK